MTNLGEYFDTAGKPPLAKKVPYTMEHFNDRRVDEYYWLRQKESQEVLDLLHQENQYAKEVMEPLHDLQTALFQEIKSRIKETDLSVPVQKGSYLYFSKTQEGLQYPMHYRKSNSGAKEQLLLDENELAKGRDFFALGGMSVSPNSELMAYLTDTDGSEVYTLSVHKIGEPNTEVTTIESCYYGLAWSLDSSSVFYTKADDQMRPYQIWKVNLGNLSHKLVFEEEDEAFYIGLGTTKDDKFIVIEAGSKTTNQDFIIDAASPESTPIPFTDRVQDLEYSIEHHDRGFFIATNRDTDDFSLMFTEENTYDHNRWKPFCAPEENVRLLGIEIFKHHLALLERHQAVTRLRVIDLNSNQIFEIPKTEEVSTIYVGDNEEFNSNILRYEYTSMVTPRTVYEVNMDTYETKLLKQSEVLGGFESRKYKTFRIWSQARDGALVPISLVCRADLEPSNAGHPTLMYGYGSYEHSIDPTFSSSRLSLLDRGMVFAFAHIRGGGEMGRNWYLDGKMEHKVNTFTDFIDATKSLIDTGWSSSEKIAARGGSAGGMLMGAIANLEPDLYRCIVAEVPFVDCLTTILDPSLPLTTFEWEEWGDPTKDQKIYDLMKSYTPYENVIEASYPLMLVTAGLNDPRVSYWEPAKWVQRLRDRTVNARIILKTEMGAGHQGPSGRYDVWKDEASVYAFILSALEMD